MDGRGDRRGPVAIIGMACRFPGASDPAEFHDVAVAGRRMFQPVTGLPGRPMYAALVDDWTVPAVSFGDPELGPPDLGPVQKLAAEMTAVALTDAGLRDAAGTARTGLIIASVTPSVCGLVRAEFGFTAGAPYPRAAYQSSLHAVVAAARALQAGELDLAVAGGAELGIDPDWLALQERAGTLGTDEMRVYAADPAGLLPGEGCGIVVLAHTADARAAGVPVYAEIAGWSTWPALAPALAGPASLLAYQQAGIDPADIQFVEGQGTGTSTGDSAELAMLTQLRRRRRTDGRSGGGRGIGQHRVYQGGGWHRQPGQDRQRDGRGNDSARYLVRAAASAARVGPGTAPDARATRTVAGRDTAGRGELPRYGRPCCHVRLSRRPGRRRRPSRTAPRRRDRPRIRPPAPRRRTGPRGRAAPRHRPATGRLPATWGRCGSGQGFRAVRRGSRRARGTARRHRRERDRTLGFRAARTRPAAGDRRAARRRSRGAAASDADRGHAVPAGRTGSVRRLAAQDRRGDLGHD